jgi:flagellar M-ring protein FliF
MAEETTTPTTAAQLRDRVTTLIAGFSRGQRLTLAVAAGAVVVLVLAVSYVRGNGPYAPLYTDLAADDVGVVTKKLTERGVPYRLTGGGGTVEVPAGDVYQLRADLAEVALPSTSKVGYGVLDSQGMTASDFSQRVGFQRAMEGEMARTIEAIDGVEAATVHLALPKDEVFALDEGKASASVLVKTSGTLAAEQVQAIVNIVASGIRGLSADRVSVADAEGRVLAAPGTGLAGASATGGRQADALNSFESNLGSAIESLLTASLGPGKAKVRVAATLNFDQVSSTSETYEPPVTLPGATTGLSLNESTKRESYGGAGGATAGQLGTEGTAEAGGGGANGYTLDQRQVNYALNKVTETTNQAPGSVQRLSVAVLVDEQAVDEAAVAQIDTLVSAAAGIDPARGDAVVVTRMPFDSSVEEAMKKELESKSASKVGAGSSLMLFVAAGIIGLLIVVSTFLVLRRRKKDLATLESLAARLSARTEPESGALADQDTTVVPVVSAGNDGASVDGRFGTAVPHVPGSTGEGRRSERREVLTELIDNQPDEVAQLLRDWLGDRRAVRR